MKSRSLAQIVCMVLLIIGSTSAASGPTGKSAELTRKQTVFLYCLHADEVQGDVGFVSRIARDHDRALELKELISSSAEDYSISESDMELEIRFTLTDRDLIHSVWDFFLADIESFSVGCIWPEPAVSTSTLMRLNAFDPVVTMETYGLDYKTQPWIMTDGH